MIKRVLLKYWPVIFLTILCVFFFNKILFFGEVFINPDYGRSDLLHFNIPIHYSAWNAIRNFEVPFWEPKIGQGFPLLDEGQVGFFYLPNLLLSIFPFWISFNIGLVFSFWLAAIGTYFLARSLNLSKESAILAGLTYAFSPILVLRLHHYNLIQSAAIFPLVIWSLNSLFNTKKIVYFGIFSLLLSQQIFAGFQQLTTYSLIASFLFFVYKAQTTIKGKKQLQLAYALFFASVIFSLLISAVQLNSTINLLNSSSRIQTQTPQKILGDFPYNPSNLKTLFDPFILGSASDATYPKWSPGSWGIFWENNTYFGLLQLLLILLLTTIIIRNKKARKTELLFFYFLGILGILLALGKFGPLHPIFSIPPISFFRVPSRFLIFTFLSAAILSGAGLDHIKQRFKITYAKIILIIVLAFSIMDLFRVWYNYPLSVKINDLQEEPQFLTRISKEARVATFGQTDQWNNIFLEKGWKGQSGNYLFFKNMLDQNLNLIYGINNVFSYAAMAPRRTTYVEALIKKNVVEEENSITFSKLSENLLAMTNTKYVISTKQIKSDEWEYISSINNNQTMLYLYSNKKTLPKVFAVTKFQTAKTLDEIVLIINSEQFDPKYEIVLEEPIQVEFSDNSNLEDNNLTIINNLRNKMTITSSLTKDSILVLSDSYYPGWKATIDGKDTKIFPANINSRGIVLPKGEHIVEFKYEPERIYLAALISIIAFICSVTFIAKYRNCKL